MSDEAFGLKNTHNIISFISVLFIDNHCEENFRQRQLTKSQDKHY